MTDIAERLYNLFRWLRYPGYRAWRRGMRDKWNSPRENS
jgi:hypothetical protein